MNTNSDDFVEEEPNPEAKRFYGLLNDYEQPLYEGSKARKLSTLIKLLHIKSIGQWSNASFTMLLKMLKEDLLPDGSNLPDSYYKAKKVIRKLGLSYQNIDACKNNCILYWKDDKILELFKVCGASRWKENQRNGEAQSKRGKKIPCKILHYFPLKPRLQRLFMSSKTSSLMRWHHDERVDDGIMRHPVDSVAWKRLDELHPSFGIEPCNVRLGLASDGWSTKGKLAYPCGNKETISIRLDNGQKQCYMHHRHFLPLNHKWKKDKDSFDGTNEQRLLPKTLSGNDILDQVGYSEGLTQTKDPRKKIKISYKNRGDNWNKKSIFFDLPYWNTLLLRHNLDVMHIEKNICDNILGTILNVKGKTKDTLNSQLDLFHMRDHDKGLRTQNCGVVVVCETDEENKNIDYYGELTKILELQFTGGRRVVLFRCMWFDVYDQQRGIKVDEYDLGVAQWFGLGTFMLEVSSSKPLTCDSKGFAFWVELVASGLPSVGYLSYVVCELLHRSGGFTLCAPKG
ncbi:hypothetical protein MTR67_012314 [Solanum verrucosum]|uniref:DUF4216 domain-containing protein n=1 Tax=Solanum verrucosum TaxID=315347 RepID=A0AAF0Q8C9_SOLVR|nr:hypothetical protein MTR67_012314 [Solanum verrucosum]